MNMLPRATILGIASLVIGFPGFAGENPYQKPDETWISVSGSVTTVTPDSFMLDYGDGVITVEMDDWDADADAYKVAVGDRVTVTGKIDDDMFETTTIEASSVYVEDLNTYFYARATDEEDFDTFITYTTPVIASATVLQGTVTEVEGDEFILNTGLRSVRVETEDMAYDPLDDQWYQQIDVGDRVSVSGEIDHDFFEGREFVATSILTLSNG